MTEVFFGAGGHQKEQFGGDFGISICDELQEEADPLDSLVAGDIFLENEEEKVLVEDLNSRTRTKIVGFIHDFIKSVFLLHVID